MPLHFLYGIIFFTSTVMLLDRWAMYLPSGQGEPVIYRLLQVLWPLESQSSLSHSCKYPTPLNDLLTTAELSGDPNSGCLLQLGLQDRAWATHSLSWYPAHLQRYSVGSQWLLLNIQGRQLLQNTISWKIKAKKKFKKYPTNWVNAAWERVLQTG